MTDFRNVKLKVLSREHSAAFQEAAFEAGVRWVDGEQEVKRTEAKYLFVSDFAAPKLMWDDSPSVFENSARKEILFTTPAYLKTKIQIRDKEHFDFVLEKLEQNGVQDTGFLKALSLRNGDYIVVGIYGSCGLLAREKAIRLDDYKEIFIEKDDAEPDGTTKTVGKLVVDVEANITTRFTDTETTRQTTPPANKVESHMAVCPQCGNKRCNKASNPEYKCTATNDTTQPAPETESEQHPVGFIAAPGYERLVGVLSDAHDQAAHGKGKDRHANNLPFHEQRMQTISKLIKNPKGMEFQAIKKLTEGMQFDDHDKREAELLGAINYIAGIVIYFRESGDEAQ